MIELKNCLIKYFDELIIRLCGQFTFNAALYSRYRLESVKRQFFVFQMCWRIYSFVIDLQILMKVILDHVLNCLLMMPGHFVSSHTYHFTSIFARNNIFTKDLQLLCTKANLRYFSSDDLYYSGHDSKQNRCMYFLVAKQPCELAVKLSEVWMRISINEIVSIPNDLLIDGKYGLSSRKEKIVVSG